MTASMMSEGTESTRTLEFLAWLEVNKKRLAIGGAVAVVVCCTLATLQWLRGERERSANAALFELQSKAETQDGKGHPSASAYEALAVEQAGTRAAARAQLLAAEVLFREGHYDEARKAFEQAANLVGDDSLVAVAAYGSAASLEALGRADEAIQAYQQVVLKHATASVAGQARLAMAAIYEQRGDWAQALRSYGELTNQLESTWSSEAWERSQALLQLHPELAPSESASPTVAPESAPATNSPSAE